MHNDQGERRKANSTFAGPPHSRVLLTWKLDILCWILDMAGLHPIAKRIPGNYTVPNGNVVSTEAPKGITP